MKAPPLADKMFHKAWAQPLGSQIGGAGDADEYSWFLSWMPFAVGHGLDPLVSHYVGFPTGVNLMWNTSVLLPSLPMAPTTAAVRVQAAQEIRSLDIKEIVVDPEGPLSPRVPPRNKPS